MRDNWNCQVTGGSGVLLRPYMRSLVEKYHSWMEDEWLRECTASEQLTMDEELAMQAEWRDDAQKATFIVFDRASADPRTLPGAAAAEQPAAGDGAWSEGMVGDVNLFLLDDDEGATEGSDAFPECRTAEVMVMTAEPALRRSGVATEAVALMLRFGAERLGVRRFVAKISQSNTASLRLFTERLGFEVYREVEAFEETHLRLQVTDVARPLSRAVEAAAEGGAGPGAGPSGGAAEAPCKPAEAEPSAWEGRVMARTGGWEVAPFENPEPLE
ncbi:hypothetical protein FNF31_00666 [Cafeteria roenbergensis]|uniref:N-acetyltransferase domain-containing protein n=1 Tax=Cafeteria roenbergensis TaxID=33653 RepID=A0A5A8DCS3_CAFRO|nr:hypothetical protein FNF28_04756 [Cafeteria roenbergensis]KAA0167731.1 hypothetical protein FNF31_00666 [Cafeteria roenbergensis]